MKSESEATFAGNAPPKTYGSLHAARAGRRSQVATQEDAGFLVPNEAPSDKPTTLFKRGVIAIGVILFFGVTLSAAHLRWTTGEWETQSITGMRAEPGTFDKVCNARGTHFDAIFILFGMVTVFASDAVL